jgi:hypothetical protein
VGDFAGVVELVDAPDLKANNIKSITIKTLQKQRYELIVKVEIASALQAHWRTFHPHGAGRYGSCKAHATRQQGSAFPASAQPVLASVLHLRKQAAQKIDGRGEPSAS